MPVKSPLILKDYFYANIVSASANFILSSRALYLIWLNAFQKQNEKNLEKVYLKCHFRIVVPLSAAVLLCHLLLSAKLTFYVNSTPPVM